ncbi:hypothetical protein M409DRAFT_17022 [Zasmidium cellare ATCC 36951]|uniref:Enoyl reductase (ER) domain-containing protein n=1 Tax=Zasmidium cellare ATCC 36951 TaxID=1080233 RepID=A0A6A6D1X8_ZASCE|nr:uncharacterized protein M409DRAFT_17022 [Zasmidium cellare ATCC 36951]KAF2173073.1 hypothetical protein M409DRAFT_17022 [Zasmidium cellare ATCC 36951]
MKGARVTSWGSPPEYIDVPDLPEPSSTQLRLRVLAAGVPRAVKGRAAAQHPSAFNQPLPYDPSIDGVGRHETTGDLYFINSLAGSIFAEYANIDRDQLYKLDPGTDPTAVAALANNTLSSWMALQCRAIGGCKDRTVVILGATSNSGRCAAKVARILGATKVVGISRNSETLAKVEGLDERIVLKDPLELPQTMGPTHIVLDFVGGPAAIQLLQSAEADPVANLQYIQTGGLAGCEFLNVPARLINVKPIRIMASGIGSLSQEEITRELSGFVGAMVKLKTPPFEVLAAPLSDVNSVWDSDDAKTKRLVLLP